MAQINKSSDYFNTKLYTGTNATQSITGVGFQPDFTWFKRRDSSAQHSLFDSVRGVTKQLASNLTNADTTITDALSSFDSDGFTLGVDSGNYINFNGATYASWNWLASNTTASNTDGSITSTVSANTTSGFSIVSYTGTGANATVGHGLSSAPKMVIVKDRDNGTYAWHVYHVGIGATKTIYLNLTNTPDTNSIYWNNTAPTSSVFSVGTSVTTTNSGDNFIAYCFAEKKGFSKFGSYTGNGSADGTFVYTGFKPAFVIIKQSNDARDWIMVDNKRNTFNVVNNRLFPNSSDAQNTSVDALDFTAQGFKIRNTNTTVNVSGGTYIYMAFAESPLVGTNNIPATAR